MSTNFSGMSYFVYKPVNSSGTNRGVYWLLNETSSSAMKKLSLDDQTDEFNYVFLVINSYGCAN